MTDNEIKKAIEICAQNSVTRHNGLTYQGMPLHFLFEEILGFVNRQNSNIEELKSKNSNLTSDLSSARAEIERLKVPKYLLEPIPLSEKEMREALKHLPDGVIPYEKFTIKRIDEEGIKAEAVEEFAEMVKETAVTSITIGGSTYLCVGLHHLDNLVKRINGRR